MAGNSVSITGNDTLTLNAVQNVVGFAAGKVSEVIFSGDIIEMNRGKNGNVIVAEKNSGYVAEMTLWLLRGCADDRYLNGLLAAQINNFAGTVANFGQFIKKVGDGQGNITSDTYTLGTGLIQKIPHAETDTEGDTKQAQVEWKIKWGSVSRQLT